MNIIQDFIPKRYNQMEAQYITIHETGNTAIRANAKMHANYLRNINTDDKCWHFTVDDHSIYQHIPCDFNGWHATDGNGQGNRTTIGIEMCVNDGGDYEKTLQNTIWLCKKLIQDYPTIEDVVPHKYWYSKKTCPYNLLTTGRWEWFQDQIYKEQQQKHWAEQDWQELNDFGIEIHEKRFDDSMTRGEQIVLANRLVKAIMKRITW